MSEPKSHEVEIAEASLSQGPEKSGRLWRRCHVFVEFVKFNMVGAVNTLVFYLVYSGLIFVGLSYELALTIDYVLGTVSSFLLNKKITFRNKERINAPMVQKMFFSYLILFFINFGLLALMIDGFFMDEYLSQFLALGVIAVISYLFQKFFVFKKWGASKG